MPRLPSIAKFAAVCLAVFSTTLSACAQDKTGEQIYKENCAECHGPDRLGLIGPALLPQNLKRLRKKKSLKVIAEGLIATQMPAFGDTLTAKQIKAVSDYIYTKLPYIPVWGKAEIDKSRIIAAEVDKWIKQPTYNADPLNLFVVVESGDHHVSILNGDTFERIHRFKSRFALHGGPKFTPDGRFVFFAP